MSWLFSSGGWSIGASASASVLLINIRSWSPLGWTGWISLQSKGLSGVFSNTTMENHQFFGAQPSLWSNSHMYTTIRKAIALTQQTFVGKVMSLLFNMPSRLVVTFLPRSECLLISWLQSLSHCSHTDFWAQRNKICRCFHFFPVYLPWMDTMILVFWTLSFKPAFSLSFFTFIKMLFSSSSIYAVKVVSSAYLKSLVFLQTTLILACASSSLEH